MDCLPLGTNRFLVYFRIRYLDSQRIRANSPGISHLDTDATTQITRPLEDNPDAQEQGYLVQIYGDDLGKRFPINPEISLGRALTNTIVLEAESVSRRHGLCYRRGRKHLLMDLGSTNGTLLNDAIIDGETELSHGDVLTIGSTVFKFIAGNNAEANYYEEIYQLTIIDGLTQIHNRRYFIEFLERELVRSARTGTPLSLVLFDVDMFKSLNDNYGHLFGDRVLKHVVRLAQPLVRREQLIARYGGDEFAVVLTDTDVDGGFQFAERLREAVEATIITGPEAEEVSTSLSLGIAQLGVNPLEPEEFIAIADQALYEAKRAGRNRAVAARPNLPTVATPHEPINIGLDTTGQQAIRAPKPS